MWPSKAALAAPSDDGGGEASSGGAQPPVQASRPQRSALQGVEHARAVPDAAPTLSARAGGAPRRRRGWSPEFVDFVLYGFFLLILCTSSVASSSSAPYYMRRNLEDMFLVNEFESNVAYEGIASHSQIMVWLRDIVVGYAHPAGDWRGVDVSASNVSSRFVADGVTLRVGPVRLRVVRVTGDSCEPNSRLLGPLGLKRCFAAYSSRRGVTGNRGGDRSDALPFFVKTPRSPARRCGAVDTGDFYDPRRSGRVGAAVNATEEAEAAPALAYYRDAKGTGELPYTSARTGITYCGDGQIVDLGATRAAALARIDALHDADWFVTNQGVRAIITTFAVYSPHADMFGVVRANIEILPGGALLPTYQVLASPILSLYRALTGDAMSAGGRRGGYLELLFFLTCALYAAREVRFWARNPRYFDVFWNWLEAINLSTYILVAVLRIALVYWIKSADALDAPLAPFPADFIRMAEIGTLVNARVRRGSPQGTPPPPGAQKKNARSPSLPV